METHYTPLQVALRDRNWTLSDASRVTGVDTATLSRISRGQQWPSRRTAQSLLATFPELTIEQLLHPQLSQPAA